MSSILIASPTFGEIFYTPYVQSVFALQRAFERRKWQSNHLVISYSEVSEARNFLLTYWFDKTKAAYLLFVDNDMGFPPELVLEMIGLDKPVVGVIYPKRHIDLERLAMSAGKGEPTNRAVAQAHDFIIRRIPGRLPRRLNGFIEVAGCGAGVLLIHRSAIAAMLKKLPDLIDPRAKSTSPLAKDLDRLIRAFDPIVIDGTRLSEDFSFCHRWRVLCGGEIWASVDRPVTHIGMHHFKGRYSDAKNLPIAPTALPSLLKGRLSTTATAIPAGKADRRDIAKAASRERDK